MARTNNPVVGTLPCTTCGTTATLHQTKRGKGSGLLYRRCECGCDQRTGKAVQKQWAQAMTPRPGFEHLKIVPEQPAAEPEAIPEQPKPTTELQPKSEPNEQPESEPEKPAEVQPAAVKGAGFVPVLAGVLGVGLLLLTAGRGGPMA